MAKFGEGDPRWIVADRADGANVNGWHWEEKNCVAWFRSQVEARVCGAAAEVPASAGWARITALKELKGEASLSTRKGNKKVAVYDLSVTLAWEGWDAEADAAAKGELKVTEFASANDADEIVVTVTVDGKGAGAEASRKRAATLQPRVLKDLLAIAADILLQ